MKKLLFIVGLIISVAAEAQLNGAQWVLGYTTSVLDFRNPDTITNYAVQPIIPFYLTNANICNENGDLLYFTNGIYIADKNGNVLLNGDSLSPCTHTTENASDGLDIPEGALFLPKPGDTRYYYLFHYSDDTFQDARPARLYYSIIDKQGNGGLGEVVEKNHIFYYSTFRQGGMTACRHANGRDWWIVIGGTGNNRYSIFLLTPKGIADTLTQYIGPDYNGPDDIAYSKFAMDGSKYVTVAYEGYITVMDFDRCQGRFSSPITIYNNVSTDPAHFPATGEGGAEFSPNGRFLYVTIRINMNQYDLQATNIQDSMAIYNADNTDFPQMGWPQVAPNGRIYCSTWNGGAYFLHVINKPDQLGDSCGFVYAGLHTLTISTVNLPNLINYALGPLQGSGCDTITDIRQQTQDARQIRIQPNPADKYVYVEVPMQGDYELQLLNETGQVVDKKQTRQVDIFDTENLPSGLYFIKALDKQNDKVRMEKVVVRH